MILAGMIPWLQFADKNDFQLHYNNCTTSIVQKLPNFNYQKSSLHFFFDWKCKDAAVWDIFIINKQDSCSQNSSVSLHLN